MIHQPPSSLDHIYSNCPTKIYNVQTIPSIFSDHALVMCNYKTNKKVYHPKFIKTKNYTNLTKSNLLKYISNNTQLDKLFRYSDPDLIAHILQTELNSAINIIAPIKIVQCKSDFTPYLSAQSREDLKKCDILLREAIKIQNVENWIEFKNSRNITTKNVKLDKKAFFTDKFSHFKNKWKLLTQFNGVNKQHPPTSITQNGIQYNSPKIIAELANNFIFYKILKISNGFKNFSISPIDILNKLIPRNNNTFLLPYISLNETKSMINNLKSKNSTGHDEITNKILKLICKEIAPHICHLINSIIRESKVPRTFKISRITPISKLNKPPNLLSSFRPINNLICLDKLMEEHLLKHLLQFLDNNHIIHKNHHGGRRGFSTTSALLQIQNQIYRMHDKNRISALLTTDLTAAFDTVNTEILLTKLEHYGIRSKELKLFESFLTNRYQFVEIDTFRSSIIPSPPCSVVQGSKISGLLYTIYTNEIPLLSQLMINDQYQLITGSKTKNFRDIEHLTVNYIDDSSSVISFPNCADIKTYITNYYNLLHHFYEINNLSVNSDKTKLLMMYRPKHQAALSSFSFNANGHTIKPIKVLKILGFYFRHDLKLDSQVGKICSELHNRIWIQNVAKQS